MIQARVARDVNATIVELMTQLQENFGSNEGGEVVTTVVKNPEIENSCPKLIENPETVENNLCSKLVENPQMAGEKSCPKPVENSEKIPCSNEQAGETSLTSINISNSPFPTRDDPSDPDLIILLEAEGDPLLV